MCVSFFFFFVESIASIDCKAKIVCLINEKIEKKRELNTNLIENVESTTINKTKNKTNRKKPKIKLQQEKRLQSYKI